MQDGEEGLMIERRNGTAGGRMLLPAADPASHRPTRPGGAAC